MSFRKLVQIGLLLSAMLLLFAVACGDDTADEPSGDAATPGTTAVATPTEGAATQPTQAPQTQAPTQQRTQPTPPPPPAEKLSVVTTTNILADWASVIGGDRVEVTSLLPADADPHTYQPGAKDITLVADADLVLSIGLSLEATWLEELITNAAGDSSEIVAVGEYVDPIDFVELMGEHDDHDENGEEHAGEIMGRLLIGDGETGAMSVIDLEHGDVEQDAFDLGSRAGRIYPTHSGRFAIAVSSDANTVHVFDGGIYLEEHGDHFDLVEDEVESLDIDLTGDRPVHLYISGEWATVFYDGSGDVVLLNEHELEEEGSDYVPTKFNVGGQHGAAVPLAHELFAVSIQHPSYDSDPSEYGLPVGAMIVDLHGDELFRAEEGCEGLHGDAGNGHAAVFGCVGGVLAVEADHGEYESVFIPAPAGEPDDFRITSMWGYDGLDHFFGLGSAVGLYLVEPEDGSMEQIIPASEDLRPINVAVSHDGEKLLVVMSDGELRMYDAHDMDLLASKRDFLSTPVEAGFWARPHIATAPDAIFITDSVGGEVMQLDGHDLEVVDHWDVDGNPTKIAFVGILGDSEDHEEEGHMEEGEDHGHEEEEEHGHEEEGADAHEGHDHGELDPHFWFDPLRVKQAVNTIAEKLSALDADGQSYFLANAVSYGEELDDLHHWIEEQVSQLPEDRRVLVTSHDAFQYLAQRYGFEVVGTVFPLSTEAEPSAKEMIELIEAIEHEGVPAVFGERGHSDRLAQRVAEETGAELIGGLYAGSLGQPGGEAGTYVDLMRFNVTTIVEALQ